MSEERYQPVTHPTPDEQPRELESIAGEELRAVLIHNDEVTPYNYVIQLLGALFLLSEEVADHIAWTAHNRGSAVVVVRPRAEAETLASAARGRAQREGYPLSFTLAEV